MKCGLWLFFWMYSTFWNQLCCHIGLLLSKEIRTKNNFIDAKLHIIQKHARYLFSHKVIRNVIAFILLDLDWLLLLFFVLILFIFVCFFYLLLLSFILFHVLSFVYLCLYDLCFCTDINKSIGRWILCQVKNKKKEMKSIFVWKTFYYVYCTKEMQNRLQ